MTNHRELLSYFSLTELPFTKEIPVEQLHLLPSVERNLAAVQLLVDTRGIGAIMFPASRGSQTPPVSVATTGLGLMPG